MAFRQRPSYISHKTLMRLWPLLVAFVVLLFPFEWLSQLWPFFGQVFDLVFATARAHHIGHITLFFVVGLLTLLSLPGLKVRPLLYLGLLVLLALGQEALQSLFGHHLPTAGDGLDLLFDLLGWTIAYLAVWGWQWLFERRKRKINMAQITATSAGAIILREIDGQLKVALAHHPREIKAWVLPKGHVEAGESLEQTALREIYEETGLANVQLIKHLGTILRESEKDNGDVVRKTIHFYLAYALSDNQPQAPTDSKFIEVSWFSPEEAIELLPYENEQAFVREQLGLLFQ